jgi:acetyl-CoA C-acetyltransferase
VIHDGLWDAFNDIHIGIAAENLVEQYGLAARNRTSSRPAGSKRPSASSRRDCRDEIVPIEVPVTGGRARS